MEGKRNSLASKHCQEEEEVDRISKLPDSLIHEILSFIDMRFAVQTCVLSKRWRNIWMSLPFISSCWKSFLEEKIPFFYEEGDDVRFHENLSRLQNRYVGFVNKVFELRDESDIQMINLNVIVIDDTAVDTLNRWILAAVNHNVQELTLSAGYFLDSAYEIPQHLLNCRSLKKLNIVYGNGTPTGYTHVILPNAMSLPQIKELWLSRLSVSNTDLQRLIASCPLIQMVIIQRCEIQRKNQKDIIIESRSLQFFALVDNRHANCGLADDSLTYTTKICAPNLRRFICRGFMTEDFSLGNLSSLDGAELEMKLREKEANEYEGTYSDLPAEEKEVFAKRMLKLLGAVHNVKVLTLSSGFLEVLPQAPAALYLQPPQLSNLVFLKLKMRFTSGCLRSIAYLLKISPAITTLKLILLESNFAHVEDDWEKGFSQMIGKRDSHLKFVEIREVEGRDNELKFLRFLLKNSMVLEKLNLIFRSTSYLIDRGRQSVFKNNLRALPTASSSIQVQFF